MNDRTIIIAGLGSSAIIIWWWFYMRAQMNRRTKRLTHILQNDFWVRLPSSEKNGRYKFDLHNDIPDEPFAYRAYRAFCAFLDCTFRMDRDTDS